MSLYSNETVKTKLVEPTTYNQNLSVEFRITEPCLPNIRLVDVGVAANVATEYNNLIGVQGLLKSVFLYDGQQKIDGCPDIQRYMSFKKYNKSNTYNRNLARHLSLSAQGYCVGSDKQLEVGPATARAIATTTAASDRGRVELNEYLPILDEMTVLDPTQFKALRLVVEFGQNSQDWEINIKNTHSTVRPRLIMDCLAPGSYNPQGNVSWNAIEADRFISNAIAVDATTLKRQETHTLNGFNNKSVGRILMGKYFNQRSKNVNGTVLLGYGSYGSHAQLDEAIQVTVNGGQVLPRNGVEGPNRMLSMLHDTWGESNSYLGANLINLGSAATHLSTPLQTTIGQLSYFGCFINQKVKNFQVSLTRSGLINNTAVSPQNEQLMCIVYAEISKTLMMNAAGKYDIVYN